VDDQWNGTWGLIRAYRTRQRNLCRLQVESCAPVTARLTETEAETGEAVALSYETSTGTSAKTATTAEGATAYDTRSQLPDPADPATWEGDLATLEAAEASKIAAPAATSADSADAGYGTEARGGIDYEQYEYEPDSQTEYVVTNDASATTKGFAYSGTTTYSKASGPEGGEPAISESTDQAPLYTAQKAKSGFWGVCPWLAPVRFYDVTAIDAKTYLPGGRLVYNSRTLNNGVVNGGPLSDTSAILYVHTADLWRGALTSQPEPLVLRANAGECILVRLRNKLNTPLLDPAGWNTLPPIVDLFNANNVAPSTRVGLHPQLVSYDVHRSDGSEAGINTNTTVIPGHWRWLQWYAGDVRVVDRRFRATPIEYGATNLMSSDRIQHSNKGAIGALIVEPRRATYALDPGSRVRATIRKPDGTSFRELVLLYQDDLNLQFGADLELRKFDCEEPYDTDEEKESCSGSGGFVKFHRNDPVPNLAESEDPEDSGQKAFDYRTEPLWFRMGFAPDAELGLTRQFDFRRSLTDAQVGARPQTPILNATPGQALRLRVLHAGGHARNHVLNLHGHIWEEEPYELASTVIGTNPFSEWKGARDGHGPTAHYEIIPRNGAGGKFRILGEYLYRDQPSFQFDGGLWGIIRVKAAHFGFENAKLEEAATAEQFTQQSSVSSAPAPGACVVDARTGKTTCTPR
jgi:hypothetical protein